MQSTDGSACAPGFFVPTSEGSWDLAALPEVDDVRPKRCHRCRHPARLHGRICLQGHGVRVRRVLVPPVLGAGASAPRVVECWGRRYRCVLCGAVQPVLPRGVMPRYLYSVPAIVVAFFLVVATPIGRGLTEAAAYALQGMYEVTAWRDGGPYRWRSIQRWFAAAMGWWPSECARDLPALLVGFVQRGITASATTEGEGDLASAIGAAIASHVRWGGAM